MKKFGPFIILWLVFNTAFGQKYNDQENFKVGLNAGLNLTTVYGGEFQNPRIKYGFVVGMYYRQPIKKLKNQHLQFDLRAAFRGSSFKNEGDDHYYKMNLFYLDAPLMDYIQIGKEDKHYLILGVQYSHLINSLLFLKPTGTNPISEGIDMLDYDASLILGYHNNGYYAGWSFIFTGGFLNINDGLNIPIAQPTLGTGKSIYNTGVSVLVYF